MLKKWSSLKIVSETPDQLILKTSPRWLVVVLLPIVVLLGCVAIALAINGIYLLFTETYTLGQRLWALLVSTFFLGLGIIAPTAVFMDAITAQIWTFDQRQNVLYRVRKRFYRNRRFEYPFVDITQAYLNQANSDDGPIYRIELSLSSGKNLPMGMWTGHHAHRGETEMVEHINAFMGHPATYKEE
ncbi:MAG: hypothetical protein AAF579_01795 [Cyanobacteria bacterium P01_C01_bin.118]